MSVIFKAITPITYEEQLQALVYTFCGHLKTESKHLQTLKHVVKNKIPCRQRGKKWQVSLNGKKRRNVFKFEEKPTEEYLQRMQKESKAKHFQKCVEILKEHAANIKSGAADQPVLLPVMKLEPHCKHCGKTTWIKTTECYTCAQCARTRVIVHQEQELRNMKERGDLSTCNYHTRDHDLSDAANRHTIVRLAPNTAVGSGDPVSTRVIRGLQAANRRLNAPAKTDTQIIGAKNKISGFCEDYQIHSMAAKRASTMFVNFVKSHSKLPREEETIAACLFNCMPRLDTSLLPTTSGASGASGAGASSASRKRPRCLTPELLKEVTEKFQAEETEKKKRRKSL